jgi:hypothetical protein
LARSHDDALEVWLIVPTFGERLLRRLPQVLFAAHQRAAAG